MSKKIYHWIPSARLGGIEMAALTFIEESKHLSHVVVTGEDYGPASALWRSAGAEVVQIPSWKSKLGLTWYREWRRFVRERRIRFLAVWSPTRLSMVTSPLGDDARCVVHLGNVGGFSLRARVQELVMRAILRPACRPRLVTCSQVVLDSVAEEPVFAGLPRQVIHNSVRRTFFDVGSLRRMNAPSKMIWGMIARLDRLKDHRTLIEAVEMLPASLDFHLEIVGDGQLEECLKAKVKAAGLTNRIRFMGATPTPHVALGRWNGFVFSTTKAEGFGIAVAEAMAAGLPCVLSDVPAMRELAGDFALYATAGEPGALAERIVEIASNPSAATAMASSARERAICRYAPQEFARSYLAALEIT